MTGLDVTGLDVTGVGESGLRWTDSHCHLQPLTEREAIEAQSRAAGVGDGAAELVRRAREAGVGNMVCVGTDAASSRWAIEIADAHEGVYATVGLHPHDAVRLDDEWDALVALAASPGVVAVGETGFDLHYRHSDEASQEAAFRRQVELAHELDLALVVHTREAWDETFRVLREVGIPRRTVIHCFTGGPPEAEQAIAAGASVSFSGIVTFPKAPEVRAAAAMVPADRLLVETDAPFLAPVPHRGRANEPGLVGLVGAAVALARGEDEGEIMRLTSENAASVFRLRPEAASPSTG